MSQSEAVEAREEDKDVNLPKGHKLSCECSVCKVIKDKIEPANYGSMSNAEVNQLARDILNNKVFTDRHFYNPEEAGRMIPMVFMVMAFLDTRATIAYTKNPPGMIYEYMDKSGPRSINGYPIFFSCRMLSQEDTKRVWDKYVAMEEALKLVMGDEDENGNDSGQEVEDLDATGRGVDDLEVSGEGGRPVRTGDPGDAQYPDSPNAERETVPVGGSGQEEPEA